MFKEKLAKTLADAWWQSWRCTSINSAGWFLFTFAALAEEKNVYRSWSAGRRQRLLESHQLPVWYAWRRFGWTPGPVYLKKCIAISRYSGPWLYLLDTIRYSILPSSALGSGESFQLNPFLIYFSEVERWLQPLGFPWYERSHIADAGWFIVQTCCAYQLAQWDGNTNTAHCCEWLTIGRCTIKNDRFPMSPFKRISMDRPTH